MKCSECTRRNSDTNTFCIYCGTALSAPKPSAASSAQKKIKTILPPQDINDLINDRDHAAAARKGSRRSVHPAIVVGLAVLLGLSAVYYEFFYSDTVQIMAIDYSTSEVINGQ